MNEFNAQTGGRYVYVDDVLNLQDLALAFGHIFDECDNFIISGCSVSGSTISAGYIYLNGKIRYFSGAKSISKWPQYLYEKNSTESVHYASGNTQIGRNIYGVSIGSTVPTTADPLTSKTPVSMIINKTGGTLLKDAFFGKYALILNAANLSQVLNGSLKISGDLEVSGNVRSLQNRYRIVGSQATFDAFFNTGKLYLQTQYDSGNNTYSVSMENGVGVNTYINNTLISKTNTSGISVSGYVNATLGIFGSTGVNDNGVYNRTDATNNGSVNINMVGYNGETQYYRNTVIGNGKNTAILSVNGKDQTVNIGGVTTIASGTSSEGLVFSLNKTKDNVDLQKSIVWKDSTKSTMGILGFTENTDATFRITNNLAGVYIYGTKNSFVDLGPTIKENGQLLTDKYVQTTNFDSTIKTLARVADVYTKTQSDARYSKLTEGFNGYLSNNTKQTLRQQIDAISSSDLDGYIKKSMYLSDIATDETSKQTIRTNIGAAAVGDFQTKLKDSGWIKIANPSLYIRQIGNIVCVQGIVNTIHSGILFVIPNTLDAPSFAVSQMIRDNYRVEIDSNSRNCRVAYCMNECNKQINFSITYMV